MPLADDIIASWRDEPDRWRWHVIWMRRDDGIEVCMQQPYTSNTDFAVMLLVQENSDAANN